MYRDEWETALSYRLTNKKYLIPICLENTDLYKDSRLKLPNELERIHALSWDNKHSIENLIKELASI